MDDFLNLFSLIFSLLRQEFTVWGFTFSIWQIIVLYCFAGIVGYFIRGLFDKE